MTTPTPHFPTEVGSSTVFLLEALEQPVHRAGASCQLSVGVQLPNGSRARDMPRSQVGRGAGPSATPWRPGGGSSSVCPVRFSHSRLLTSQVPPSLGFPLDCLPCRLPPSRLPHGLQTSNLEELAPHPSVILLDLSLL